MKQIGILIEKSRAYGRSLIEGVADFAQGQGDWTLRPLSSEDMSAARFGEYDGIIARIADRALAERLVRSGVPAVDVFCQQSYPGLAGVDSDHRRIGEMARDFFRSRGFVHLAFCGLPGIAFSDARQAAFADESTHVYAHAPILPTADSQFFNERLDRIPDARMLKRWLVALPKPVAVFCCNDLRAIQLQRVAIENGLRVPQDVAILGADNDTIACSFADVPISSIDPNAFEIGKSAARILATMLRRKPERKLHRVHSVRPGAITERTSTEFMPIDPPWLGKVLMHIEKNIGRLRDLRPDGALEHARRERLQGEARPVRAGLHHLSQDAGGPAASGQPRPAHLGNRLSLRIRFAGLLLPHLLPHLRQEPPRPPRHPRHARVVLDWFATQSGFAGG